MRDSKRPWLVLLGGACLALGLLAVGCASSKKQAEEFPQTVQAVVEASPSEPDRIDYLDVNPWSLEPGASGTVTLKGTADRTAKVVLKGLEGDAAGKAFSVGMSAGTDGTYTGQIVASEALPPGKYRVEGELLGGPTGEPTKLVSSRVITILAPPPPVDPCEEFAKSLAVPKIHFDFDKSDIQPEAASYIEQFAAELRQLAPRVSSLTVEGHCDERGTVEYNLALGARRALAVRDALLAQPGLEGMNIGTLSRGEEDPVIPNAKTEAEHAQNRRAVLRLECRPR